MNGQAISRFVRKPVKSRSAPWQFRFDASSSPTPVRDAQTGFVQHPQGAPLEFRRIRFADQRGCALDSSDFGLLFESDRYVAPGSIIEVNIPLRNGQETFRGKVVMVRHYGGHYEIGLWLRDRADASRVRIVEQVCHIEAYLRRRKFEDGPYILNRERIAQEWITKYAAGVPPV
jgi:hypothetical protein